MPETCSNESNNAEILFRKGRSLYYDENASEAAAYFLQAAEQEHPEAACFFAYCCEEGLGVPQDPEKAVMYYQQAEEVPYAVYRLGVYAETAGEFRKAAEYYLQCLENLPAEEENSYSLLVDSCDVYLHLGGCLLNLPTKDRPYFAPSPMDCFREAFNSADFRTSMGEALFQQGRMYLFGIETDTDLKEALALLTEAAEYGSAPAAALLEDIRRWEQNPADVSGTADAESRKKEALLRLEILERKGVDPDIRSIFAENGLPGYAADDCGGFYPFSEDIYPEIRNAVEQLERGGMTVYFIHVSLTVNFGCMASLFFVSDNPEEWPSDRRDLLSERPIAAVANLTEDFTEIGEISFFIRDNLMERRY